jgi:hypothetical protein
MGKNKPFPLKSRMSQWCLLSPLLFSVVLEFLVKARKRSKRDPNREERIQIVPICGLYDSVFKRPQRFHQKISYF